MYVMQDKACFLQLRLPGLRIYLGAIAAQQQARLAQFDIADEFHAVFVPIIIELIRADVAVALLQANIAT